MSRLNLTNKAPIASTCFNHKASVLAGAWRPSRKIASSAASLTLMEKTGLLAIVIAATFVAPTLASAKTLTFGDKTWDVTPLPNKTTDKILVRNDFDLQQLTAQSLLGQSVAASANLLDNLTATTINDIASGVFQKTQEPELTIEGKVAKTFVPPQNGQALDVYALVQKLNEPELTIDLPVITSEPMDQLGSMNDVGIKELVAVGESNFKGSPRNRIHNITVGAEKFNGLVIDQGQEFSFNEYLGDVDAEHGFLPELVIKKTGVTPEFGGGLCQVSSTTFRAAMNAGLPITARRNHSFAVQYYAPQGTDATIYPGVQDLKFVNNLHSAILIRTRIDGTKLYFEFYGTKDDRVVTFDGPVQYDRKPDGSLKATWTRHVAFNGQTTDQTFNSTYQPPALFHKEEQPTTPNPETVPTTNNQPVTQTN